MLRLLRHVLPVFQLGRRRSVMLCFLSLNNQLKKQRIEFLFFFFSNFVFAEAKQSQDSARDPITIFQLGAGGYRD